VRQFRGALVLVTGAGSGIGRATALRFARERARLVLVDIDEPAAAATARLAGDLGAPATVYRVDVGDRVAMEGLTDTVRADLGVPDIIVNNAGIGIAGAFLDTPPDLLQRVVDVNLWGVVHGCRLFGAQMVARGGGGHIVNVASAAAFAPSRILPVYSMTKAAVLMLSESLRAELAPHRIGVSAICPGIINTGIVRTTHYVGDAGGGPAERREAAIRLYRRRGYGPERVAERILVAVRRNAAVMPVTPEAHALRTLSRLSPGALRRLARARPL
jgi:NAD(P)-dependent dehydrogenase (short-subunit alcohol dehydrogenase family)